MKYLCYINNQLINNKIKMKSSLQNIAVDSLLNFKDGEVWVVTKVGNEILAKPYNELAKKQNVSLSISFTSEYLSKSLI